MAFNVQHGPSMVDYGMAIAKAAQKTEAANRAQQYGSFLSDLQGQNQSYALGLGNLGVAQDKVGLEATRTQQANRELDIREYLAKIEGQKAQNEAAALSDQTKAQLYQAIAARESSYSQLMGGHSRLYGGGGYQYVR